MAVIKDFSTIVREMEQLFKLRLPNANRGSGSVVKEAFINTPAAQLAFLHSSIAQADVAKSVATAAGTDLDNLASNNNVVRNSGTSSSGTVYFILPESFPTGNDIVINNGQTVSSRQQRAVDFTVVGTTTLSVASASLYETQANRRASELARLGYPNVKYLAVASIEAVVTGRQGNVGIGTLTIANIPGVQAIVNLETTIGGTDSESDTSLRKRVSLALISQAIGTSEAYQATALEFPEVTSALVVGPGNPLMTRDGTVYDDDGEVIEIGSRRAVDIWVNGESLDSSNESFTYTDVSDDEEGPVAIENQKLLGYEEVTNDNPFALQPVTRITSLSGSESGSSFAVATEVEDDEGNILFEGNYTLMKDVEASNYAIVREVTTGKLRVARYLDPFSTKYALIQPLVTSEEANSAKGRDKLIFTSDRITITDEAVTRGSVFAGADFLENKDILEIAEATEDINIEKEIVVVGSDHFNLTLNHKPILTVTEVKHVRLGSLFDFTVTDTTSGTVSIAGRFIPQSGDLFQVTYTWRKEYIGNLEYFLEDDSISWVKDVVQEDQRENSLLIETSTLELANSLGRQPLTPTYLKTNLTGIKEREKVTLTVSGNSSNLVESEDSKVLEIAEQRITLRRGTEVGTVHLESDPKDPTDISIYAENDVFRRNIVDYTSVYTNYNATTRVFNFSINSVLFSNLFLSTQNELPFVSSYEVDKPFTFEVLSQETGLVGKVLRVRNLTKNIEYSLLDYNLRTNIIDNRAIVNEGLAKNQFSLSLLANQTTVDIGNKLRFQSPPSRLHWTTKDDFNQNVGDNLVPTIDTTKVVVEDTGDVRLNSIAEQAVQQTAIQVGGDIDADVAWSGSVEVLDDVIVKAGKTLTIRPGTIVRVRDKDQAGKALRIEVQGRLVTDPSTRVEDPIIFTSMADTKAPGDWEGILFTGQSRSLDTTTLSSISHAEIRYAVNAVSVDDSNPRIRLNRLSNNSQRGILYTADPDEFEDVTLLDTSGNTVGWDIDAYGTDAYGGTRIPLIDSNGIPIKLMTSNEQVPFGETLFGKSYGLDDGTGADGISGTADDGYGADGISGTADDGYGADGKPYWESTPNKQVIHFTPDVIIETANTMNPTGYDAKYNVKIDGTTIPFEWASGTENAWIEYVGKEQTFYLVLNKNTTNTAYTSSSVITLSYLAPKDAGLAYQNIIEDNGTAGISVGSSVALTFAGNTLYSNGAAGIDATDSYLTVRNNLIQEYITAPLSFDHRVIAEVRQNDMWSSLVEEQTLNQPTDHIILASDVSATEETISFVYKAGIQYRSGQIIKIDNEKVRIQAITVELSNTTLVVTRGIQGTVPAVHTKGTTALLYGDKALFLVTGIPGNECTIVPCDPHGNIVINKPTFKMLKQADGTFRTAVALDRSKNYYYRYRFINPAHTLLEYISNPRVLNSSGTMIGNSAIDTFNPIEESFEFQRASYSADPQFTGDQFGDYSFDSDSPAHRNNLLYADQVSVFKPYQGREKIQEIKQFTSTDIAAAGGSITSLIIADEAIIQTSVRVDIVIFAPTGVSTIYSHVYDNETKTVSLDASTPIITAGTYLVQYYKPVNLGTTLPGYNYLGEISYVVDAGQTVDYTTFQFTNIDSGGGSLDFQFRYPDTEDQRLTDLRTAAFGPVYNVSPTKLVDIDSLLDEPISSRYLEIRLRIRSNWKGFTSSDEAVFPILEDMTLSYTPASDLQAYAVKETQFLPRTNTTRVTIAQEGTSNGGITEDTFRRIGSDSSLNVLVLNETTNAYESVAISKRISLGATTTELVGNFTEVFAPPQTADIYLVDYLWIVEKVSERLTFVENSTQITTKQYASVSTISTNIVRDRQTILPEEEQLTVNAMSQPETSSLYTVDYDFVAPKEGEVIEAEYVYNDLIRTVSLAVEEREDAIADVLVREMIKLLIRVEVKIGVARGAVFTNVRNEVEVAITQYFSTFPETEEEKIDSSDIVTLIGNVEDVDSVTLVTFNEEPLTGVVSSIPVLKNEIPVSASGYPIISDASKA